MLQPKKTKFRKQQKGRIKGIAFRGHELAFGSFGIKSLETSFITGRQIEAARRVMTKYVKKGGKIWIRIFPDKPVTAHGGEIPMGKGKGAVDYYVAIIKPGMVMFEMEGIDRETAKTAMELAAHKLPIKCRFITKED